MVAKTFRELSADTAPALTRIIPTQAPTGSTEPTRSTIAQLLAMFGLGTMSTQAASAVAVTGGSVVDAVLEQAVVTISGNTTLTAASHQGRTLFCTAAVSLTVDSSTDFAQGKGCNIVADGGIVTIVATATVNRAGSKPLTIPRYDAAGLIRTSTTDVYLLFGGMA